MSAKIGIISDIHATAAPLGEALTIFEQERVDHILCLGDIAGYGTELEQSIELLVAGGCIAIQGNHDVWHLERQKTKQDERQNTFLHKLPGTWQSTIAGKSIFAVHASPPTSMRRGITLLDQHEKTLAKEKEQWDRKLAEYSFDVLLVGHTHQVFAELLGQVFVINPGSTTFNNSCAILSLPDLEVRFITLLGKTIRKIWHWGLKT